MNVIHVQARDVPRKVSLEMLAKIAVIVDYYKCHNAIHFFSQTWVENLGKPLPSAYGIDLLYNVMVYEAVEKMRGVASSIRHPLEQLKPGARAKITSDRGDYTLAYCESIMFMENSLVFKAQHPRVAGVVAVKVLRTPSYPVNSGTPGQSASKIARASEMWPKEFKNHSKLSQHDTTVHVGGSPWYIPPEDGINGKRGAPGDAFALGVVMLFVLEIPLPDLRPGLIG
ncbi:hypothetical protein ColTof3_08443 [Colletotrichum tofieldiae]|nr:hypothetical protein ColTof3_08443 [Colletotrichum tofieldiae]